MNKYLKDSDNFYTLFIEQGTSVSIEIPLSSFGIPLEYTTGQTPTIIDKLSALTFTGIIKKHPTSIPFVNFVILKNIQSQSIKLTLSNTSSQALTDNRYNFDIKYTDASNNTFRAFGGQVIVTQNLF